MRRVLVVWLVGLIGLLGLAVPALAQDGPTVGDRGPASGDFEGTDEACGFGNFTDGSYTAALGEDEQGVYIEFTQGSTDDTGRFRSDGEGNVRFETDGDEEYVDIDVQGDDLFTLYRYTSGDCTQEWIATVTLPAGFVEAMISANRAPAPEPEPEPEPETSEPPPEPETSQPAPEPATSEPPAPATTSGDDGSDWAIFLGFLGLLLLFLIALFLLWRRRNQRLYRFDRGDAGEIIETKPEPDPEPTPEPDPGSAGPPGIIVVDDDPVRDAPPPEGDCIPEREEFEMAKEAKDAAYAAGEQADGEFVHARDEHGRILATTKNPLGENPPAPAIDTNASEREQARQQRVHELDVAQWQELEDEATAAKAQLAGAEAALDKARADRDEAWQDFQRMRRRLEAARVALNNCDGSAGPADGEDQPPAPPETPGTGTSDGPPGIITDPPLDPESGGEDEEEGCTKGETKDGRVVSSTDFQVLGAGSIDVQVGTSAWGRHGRAFTVGGFADLDRSTVEELSAGIEQEREAVRISVRIPTDTVRVKCVQILECDGEKFVDSGRVRKVVTRTKGPLISVLPTGADGSIAKAKDRRLAGRMVEKAQEQVDALLENQESADECEFD